jgi:UDP-N-acetylmuramoyl-tripeptide--D-alanyl-D-alanine ligase
MKFRLSDLAAALGLTAKGEAAISGWSIDSRTIEPRDAFFALQGPHHDGHDYVAQVFAKGASAAIVNRDVAGAGPLLIVPDTLTALQQLGSWARQQWDGEIIGVTGSAGKTSTKETIAALLSSAIPTGKSSGNLNNHIGVPLSLLRLPEDAKLAVIEMGMNHAGEIRTLARFAAPAVGVVTNVGTAHIENFENGVEGIAAAKRELVESLPASGVAVLNADDVRVRAFAAAHSGKTVTFGIEEEADVRATGIERWGRGTRFRALGTDFETPLSGRHSILNILAALAVCTLYGLEPSSLRTAVAALEPGPMRGQWLDHNGIKILNDCYNSNPDAARTMLDVLRETPARRRIAVLGEMLELGRWAEPLHREVGTYVARSGVDVLVGIRGAACHLVDAAIQDGLAVRAASFFETPEEAGDYLRSIAQPGDAILFKGSRGTRVEKALERLVN